MGACFNDKILSGKLTRIEVQDVYNELQNALRVQYGTDPYNGTFSNCDCFINFTGKFFEKMDEAYDWLADNTGKREVAAVRTQEDDGTQVWMIGGWCPE